MLGVAVSASSVGTWEVCGGGWMDVWKGGNTFDHAQAGAEDGHEGDGVGEDLVGLEVEAERCLVLWLGC